MRGFARHLFLHKFVGIFKDDKLKRISYRDLYADAGGQRHIAGRSRQNITVIYSSHFTSVGFYDAVTYVIRRDLPFYVTRNSLASNSSPFNWQVSEINRDVSRARNARRNLRTDPPRGEADLPHRSFVDNRSLAIVLVFILSRLTRA